MQKQQASSRASKGILNKIKRENRCIPDLIFQIEDYEKYLILLGKACKMNLLRHAKRSTARDFRITGPQEQEHEHEHGNDQEHDEVNEAAAQNELVQDSENGEEDDALLPDTGTPFAAEDSEEDDSLIPRKKSRIVEDSDDEANIESA